MLHDKITMRMMAYQWVLQLNKGFWTQHITTGGPSTHQSDN